MAGMYARKIFGDDKIKSVLKRLDRLTQDEVWTAVAQTLSIVHGLDGNMRNVIEGTQSFVDCSLACCQVCFLSDGKVSTGNIRQDLGMYLGPGMASISVAHFALAVALHKEVYESNKMKRLFFPIPIPFSQKHKILCR